MHGRQGLGFGMQVLRSFSFPFKISDRNKGVVPFLKSSCHNKGALVFPPVVLVSCWLQMLGFYTASFVRRLTLTHLLKELL